MSTDAHIEVYRKHPTGDERLHPLERIGDDWFFERRSTNGKSGRVQYRVRIVAAEELAKRMDLASRAIELLRELHADHGCPCPTFQRIGSLVAQWDACIRVEAPDRGDGNV